MSLFSGSQTRSSVARDHAVFAPESHVPAAIAGWHNAQAVILIAPRLGAKFSEYIVTLTGGASSALPPTGVERFVYVLEGTLTCDVDKVMHTLPVGGYIYLPPDTPHTCTTQIGARVVIVEKPYVPSSDERPHVVVGNEHNMATRPVAGDPDVQVKQLLPDQPEFDMAMNIMAFQPGAALSLVEVHVMEHGLLMIDGQLIYRLSDQYYPVRTGDAIYMAPACPQWCAAFGREQARYLLYKDWNRDPFGY